MSLDHVAKWKARSQMWGTMCPPPFSSMWESTCTTHANSRARLVNVDSVIFPSMTSICL